MYTAKTILCSLLIFNANYLLSCEKATQPTNISTVASVTITPSLVARTAVVIKTASSTADSLEELGNWFPSQAGTSFDWPQRVARSPHYADFRSYNRSPYNRSFFYFQR